MKQGKSRFVFPGGNTPQGFYSLYRQGLDGIDHVYILKGGPGTGKSTLMRKIGLAMTERGFDVEFWQCSSDNDSLDGVLIPALSLAVIDGTAPHVVDPLYPGAREEIVNLGEHWNIKSLKDDRELIIALSDGIRDGFAAAYRILAKAGELEEQKQSLFADLKTPDQLQAKADELIKLVLNGSRQPRHFFARAVTPQGLVSFKQSLSENYAKRYLLQGPACEAKNVIIQQLAAAAISAGQQSELYHSPFCPDQCEMLLLPESGIAVIAAEEDGEQLKLAGDVVIDLSDFLGVDQAQLDEASKLQSRRDELVAEAAAQISAAKTIHDELELYYTRAMDFDGVDFVAGKLFNRILALATKP